MRLEWHAAAQLSTHCCCRHLRQTQEMWSFVVPAAWLTLLATPEQRARAAAPANALLLGLFLLHYLVSREGWRLGGQ